MKHHVAESCQIVPYNVLGVSLGFWGALLCFLNADLKLRLKPLGMLPNLYRKNPITVLSQTRLASCCRCCK